MSVLSRTAYGLDTGRESRWEESAACSPETAEAFHVIGRKLSSANQQALLICRDCPVLARCGAHYASMPLYLRSSVIAGGVWWGEQGYPRPIRADIARARDRVS